MNNVSLDIEAANQQWADKSAIEYASTGDVVSYHQLADRVEALTGALRSFGIEAGDRVAIVDGNTVNHVVSWYAILRAGAIAVDFNFLLSGHEWGHVSDDCAPRLAIVGKQFTPTIAGSGDQAIWEMESLWDHPSPTELRVPRVHSLDDPAVIAYTSGTTGLPRGVVHSHRSLARQLDLLQRVCGYDDTWTAYVAVPLFALQGFLPQVAATLRFGGTVVLDDKFDPVRFAEMSRRYPITYTTLSSPMIPRLLELDETNRIDLSRIRVLSCGGAPLHQDDRTAFEERFSVHLTQGYSSTEVLGAFVMELHGDAPVGAAGRVFSDRDDPIRIMKDDAGSAADVDQVGEIAFHRSCALMRYWNRGDTDGSPFIADEWYPTGDIGRLDASGYLYVLDRKKDVVIRGGFNIYSAEIERVLSSHSAVLEAVVVGAPDDRLGEVPIAFVVCEPGSDVTDDELYEYAHVRLGRLKTPESITKVQFDDLPRNSIGKVQKAELRYKVRDQRDD